MKLLVFNCGSSSQNYKLFASDDGDGLRVIGRGKAHRVGVQGSEPSFIEHTWNGETTREEVDLPDHPGAARRILDFLAAHGAQIDAVGHRFVHGGERFQETTLLNETSLEGLQDCLRLAPIHNPNSMSVIRVCRQRLPDTPQYVVFDTAFHAALPEAARRYALPPRLTAELGLRRYGFHGLSYQFVSRKAAEHLGQDLSALNLIACHLGTGGSSVAAIAGGKPVDTSMGYSPLAGLMMSTRCGDLDPLAVLFLLQKGYKLDFLDNLMNRNSGLLGVSGLSSDIRDLLQAAQAGNERAGLAIDLYAYRLRKVIGGYAALLGRVDALIFTDDVGTQSARVRELACEGLAWAGVALDARLNNSAAADALSEVGAGSVHVLVMPTDEELVIAREGVRLLGEARNVHF